MHPVVIRLLPLVRGGRRARHVVPAVLLGAAAGAVCGWNLTFALTLTAALVINGPPVATVTAAVVAWMTTHAASSLVHSLGYFLLEKVGLGAIVDSLGHGPIAALLGWDDYALVGGAVAALCCALPVAHTLARRAGQIDPGLAATDRLLRPYWPAVATICLLLAAVLPQAVGPQLVGKALLEQWSAAVGVPITADELSYDVWRGELHLQGLRVYGLHEPGRVALRVDRLTAHVDPGLLLRGVLHCDEATLSGLTCDAPPESSGFGSAAAEPTVLREDGPSDAAAKQPLDVARLLRDWHDAQRRLSALGDAVGAVELVADLETQHPAAVRLAAVRRPRKAPLDALSGRALPLVQVKRLTLAGLPESWSLGPQAVLELTAATSRPSSSSRPVHLAVECPDHHARLSVEFDLNGPERSHDLKVLWNDATAASIADVRRTSAAGLDVAYARVVSVRGQGRLTRDRLDLPLVCEVRGVVPAATAGRFGDVEAAVWHDAITRLGTYRFDATLSGRLAEARLQVVSAGMVDQLKHQLRAAGEHVLVKAVEAGRFVSEPPLPVVAGAPPSSTTQPSPSPPPPAVAAQEPTLPPVAPAVVAAAPESASPPAAATSAAVPPIPTPIVPTAEAVSAAPPSGREPAGIGLPSSEVAHELRQPGAVVEPSAGPGEVHWKPDYAATNVAPSRAATPTLRPQVVAPPRGLTNLPPRAETPRPVAPPIVATPPTVEPKPSFWAKVGGWFTSDEEPPAVVAKPAEPPPAAKPMFPRLRSWFADEPEPSPPAYATVPPPGERTSPTVPPTAAERAARIPPDATGPRYDVPATAEKPWYQRMFR